MFKVLWKHSGTLTCTSKIFRTLTAIVKSSTLRESCYCGWRSTLQVCWDGTRAPSMFSSNCCFQYEPPKQRQLLEPVLGLCSFLSLWPLNAVMYMCTWMLVHTLFAVQRPPIRVLACHLTGPNNSREQMPGFWGQMDEPSSFG